MSISDLPWEPSGVDCKYVAWIARRVPNRLTAQGQCELISAEMAEAFPELTRVRGHYYCPYWGERAHWWLKTDEGQIIDPTCSQFPSDGNGEYVEWNEGDPEPTGKCPNCGEFCFDGGTCCSESCHVEYVAFVQGGLRW